MLQPKQKELTIWKSGGLGRIKSLTLSKIYRKKESNNFDHITLVLHPSGRVLLASKTASAWELRLLSTLTLIDPHFAGEKTEAQREEEIWPSVELAPEPMSRHRAVPHLYARH